MDINKNDLEVLGMVLRLGGSCFRPTTPTEYPMDVFQAAEALCGVTPATVCTFAKIRAIRANEQGRFSDIDVRFWAGEWGKFKAFAGRAVELAEVLDKGFCGIDEPEEAAPLLRWAQLHGAFDIPTSKRATVECKIVNSLCDAERLAVCDAILTRLAGRKFPQK